MSEPGSHVLSPSYNVLAPVVQLADDSQFVVHQVVGVEVEILVCSVCVLFQYTCIFTLQSTLREMSASRKGVLPSVSSSSVNLVYYPWSPGGSLVLSTHLFFHQLKLNKSSMYRFQIFGFMLVGVLLMVDCSRFSINMSATTSETGLPMGAP